MATFTVEITPDYSNGTIAHAVGKFSGGSSSYKGQRRMDVTISGVRTFSALSPETSGGENTFSLDITGLTPGTTDNWSASLYYKHTSGGWVTAGSQYDKSGSFTTKSKTPTLPKTLINGTAYTVQGGKCMVNGTVYNILKGRTLIDGTGWDIAFPSAIEMPAKGDLITMNLDGTDRLYRVLKIVDGTTVEVLGMWNVSTSTAFDSNATNTYRDNALDTYLNTTWYNTLSTAAKNAIVAKDINQYQYTYNSSAYNQTTHSSYADYSTKALKANVGNRYVYALDVEDIEMYFGGTGGSVNDKTPGTFSKIDLLQMFWNQTSTISQYPWSRSALSSFSDYVWHVHGKYGRVDYSGANVKDAARVSFQIDLSKIDFTIN